MATHRLSRQSDRGELYDGRKLPIADLRRFWGALGCACWAIRQMAIVSERPNRSERFDQSARPLDECGRMRAAPILAWRVVGAIVAALVGIAFFFVIIGVFGLSASIAALVLFAALAILIFRRPQAEETRP